MRKLFWMLAALLFAGCEQSPVGEQSSQVELPKEYWASFEGESRTYLDGQVRMLWTKDDRLTVFRGTTYAREFAFTGRTGANAGGFKQVSVDDDFWFGYDLTTTYAVYPHSENTWFHEVDMYMGVTLPAEQSYVANSFGLGANTMVAVTSGLTDNRFIFKNVCSYLRVMLWGENQTVKKVTFSSIAGECVAGEAQVYASNTTEPTTTMVDEISTITLTCETPVEVNTTEDAPVAFWIVVPPVVLSEGYTVTVENAEGETQVYEVNKEKTFKRNVYNTLKRELAVVASENPEPDATAPAANEIWYTSSTGEVVSPYKTDVFGANIVSNTYENGKGVITFDGPIQQIGKQAFAYTDIVNITLPQGFTEIGEKAFYYSDLTSMVIPNGITTIGEEAFGSCSNLTEITIPESISSIGIRVLYDCKKLQTINGSLASEDNRSLILDGVLYAFAPANLTTYTIPSGVTRVATGAFSYNNLTSLEIPEGVETLDKNAVIGCSKLATVKFPSTIKFTVEAPFAYCKSLSKFEGSSYVSEDGRCVIADNVLIAFASVGLTSYVLPSGLTRLGDYALHYGEFTEITIPESIISIGSRTFENSKLTSVRIPEAVTSLGNNVFKGCASLQQVYVLNPEPPQPSGFLTPYWFDGNAENRVIYVPAESVEAYKVAEGWSNYADAILSIEEDDNGGGGGAGDGEDPEDPENPEDPEDPIIPDNPDLPIVPTGLVTIHNPTIGGLLEVLSAYDYAAIESMKVTGTMNDEDFLIIYYEMPALRYLDISEINITTLPNRSFYQSTNVETLILPKSLVEIRDEIFYQSKLKDVYIYDNVQTIGAKAFAQCKGLPTIEIPGSVNSIGSSAFSGCTTLASVKLNEGLQSLGDSVFSDCTALVDIHLPASLSSLGSQAFYNCTALAAVNFAPGCAIAALNDGVFYNVPIASIQIPAKVATISTSAFNCQLLKTVTFEDNSVLTTMGSYFASCPALESIEIPASVTIIETSAFTANTKLNTVLFEENSKLETISNNAFKQTRLTAISIPASCEWISYAAFFNCDYLASVDFAKDAKLRSIGSPLSEDQYSSVSSGNLYDGNVYWGAFEDCDALIAVELPASLTVLNACSFARCNQLAEVTFADNARIKTIGGGYRRFSNWGVNTKVGKYTAYNSGGAFANCISLASIEIPASVEVIENGAFSGCSSLTAVSFESGSNLTTLGEEMGSLYSSLRFGAFESSALTSITLPKNLKTIYPDAFYNCAGLKSVNFESGSALTTISEKAFYKCALTSITIPAATTMIGESAFRYNSALTTINFAAGSLMKSFGDYAFADCGVIHYFYAQNCTQLTSVGNYTFMNDDEMRLFKIGTALPPTAYETTFGDVGTYAVLKVPTSAVSAYQAATGWKLFSSITSLDE